ncbi:hypothetical protein SAMD00019534_008840 [Acytostelium subglobosum LB1]|uniref:hypothetical protein n=1 Tax=Acytostelium subglobosum LB1 TaxID=1410327 RepID=UPI0006450BB4|nr:hypothetical protein SAMD00019534_008840 [Acytostelium subglobosum LB1]GAM17709.1 hypothetical protein SAMD00019534_008840 [Acytostelium subglobosum LB1]|eukprot:XP_012758305.1 hypothetical protein SAMD00019534_008840 [Acytostelium subglobosum LB1]
MTEVVAVPIAIYLLEAAAFLGAGMTTIFLNEQKEEMKDVTTHMFDASAYLPNLKWRIFLVGPSDAWKKIVSVTTCPTYVTYHAVIDQDNKKLPVHTGPGTISSIWSYIDVDLSGAASVTLTFEKAKGMGCMNRYRTLTINADQFEARLNKKAWVISWDNDGQTHYQGDAGQINPSTLTNEHPEVKMCIGNWGGKSI